jgi:type VI secretion system secreted protein VgrG
MKPKSGSIITSVTPIAPAEVFSADEADPSKVAQVKAKQIEQKKGKYGTTKVKPFTPPSADAGAVESAKEEKTASLSWVEFALTDENNKPLAGEKYEVELPDGSIAKGTTDSKGKAKIEGFETGPCKLTLPNLHKDAW